MKKVKLVSLILIACFIVISAGTAMAEKKIVYEKKLLFEGKYGTNPGEYDACPDCDQTIYWIVLDMQGNIYLLDYLNDRIQKYGKDGNFLKIIPIKCTEERKEQNYIIEDGKKLKHGYKSIPIFKIRRFWVDKDGFLYAYEDINKEHIKYDQKGKELGRTKQAIGVHYINGKPFTFTGAGKNEITYIRLEGNSVIKMEARALPKGDRTIKGNFYLEDLEKLNSYWIEDGENEKEKKIIKKDKEGNILKEIKINWGEKIKYLDLIHIDKLGNIYFTISGSHRIYDKEGNVLSNGSDIPLLYYMEYIMDKDGNIYKLENGDSSLTLTKWERKYIE